MSQNIYVIGNQPLRIGCTLTAIPNTTTGGYMSLTSKVYTDAGTASSGTLSNWASILLNASTLAASNSSVTTTNASTLCISGSPIAGTNETIVNSYSLLISSGNSKFNGDINSNSLSLSGSSSGVINLTPQAAAGTYNFNYQLQLVPAGKYLHQLEDLEVR